MDYFEKFLHTAVNLRDRRVDELLQEYPTSTRVRKKPCSHGKGAARRGALSMYKRNIMLSRRYGNLYVKLKI